MALPASYRWSDTPQASFLYRNYACVAVVRPGRVEIARGRKKAPLPPLVGVCGSIEQGKRHVERWFMARHMWGNGRPSTIAIEPPKNTVDFDGRWVR